MAREDFQFVIDDKEWALVVSMARQLAPKVGQNAVNKVVKQGVEAMLQTMRFYINEDAKNPTGNLSKSLSVMRKKKYEPTFWFGAVAVRVGKTRQDGAFYWHMVEKGHRIMGRRSKGSIFKRKKQTDFGKKTKAMKFAIGAFELNKERIVTNFTRSVKAELAKNWNKKGKIKKGKGV